MINYKYIKTIILTGCIALFLLGCDSAGQLGGTINFNKSKQQLAAAIDTLYAKYPDYKLPQKWAQYDNLLIKKSPFLSKRIFYFKSAPEEMYYVTLIDDSLMTSDSSHSSLAIRGINRGGAWLQENKLDYKEQRAIQKRFEDEIVSKLKVYTGAKVRVEE